ncbi:MAG TPA: hypothetical protein VKZ54_12915 [Membranihabitans sp.]|nr:hypothetical protein [Membranihabitans sp.]
MSVEVTKKPCTRKNFIDDWSEVAVAWGMSKKMAAIHAYLLTAKQSVTAEELVEELDISRGCVSTNLSQLVKYGFVQKANEPHRRDYFTATKNTFSILQSVIAYRKERELAPLLRLLDNYCPSQMANEIPKESVEMICDIRHYAMKSERFLSSLENSSESVFIRTFLRMI